MLTSIYPSDDICLNNSTSVCHYFAQEWVKLGYNVIVIYNYNYFPVLIHAAIKMFKKRAIQTSYAISESRITNMYEYNYEGVSVCRIPIFKKYPGARFKTKDITLQTHKIIDKLKEKKFQPDVIVGHFIHPNLEIGIEIKNMLKIPFYITLHGELSKKKDYSYLNSLFSKVDGIGYRSIKIKKTFEERLNIDNKSFICYSGIPSKNNDAKPKDFSKGIINYIYVGNLIKRKYPLAIVKALYNAKIIENSYLKYVGTGFERKKIEKYINSNKLHNRVIFTGRLDRTEVYKQLTSSECFIMISEKETFGLVYLEAMSNGCIVIASKEEGMDGIIIDGINGYLCKSGDHKELSSILLKIKQLSISELTQISKNAINTAKKFTDEIVAENYLKIITENEK